MGRILVLTLCQGLSDKRPKDERVIPYSACITLRPIYGYC